MSEPDQIQLHCGDCLDVLPNISGATAVCCDPPYGLNLMSKHWDRTVPGEHFWRTIGKSCLPGAPLLAFGGTRTYHRLTCAIEDAGWQIRDCLMWLYANGFPKSMDVSKAIDRQRDDRDQVLEVTLWIAEARDVAGITNGTIDAAFAFSGMAGHWTSRNSQPAVPTVDQMPLLLETLGDPDMPARISELIWTLNGRKGQPGDNWAKREKVGEREVSAGQKFVGGILDSDSSKKTIDITAPATDLSRQWDGYGTALKPAYEPICLAMKPPEHGFADNAVAHGVAGLNIDGGRIPLPVGEVTDDWKKGRWPANVIHDGSNEVTQLLPDAARFFFSGKATRSERGGNNEHPTVKPLALMRYLLTLVAMPERNLIIDPFMGSGSTGVAAVQLGLPFVGIEKDAQSFEIAKERIEREKLRRDGIDGPLFTGEMDDAQ